MNTAPTLAPHRNTTSPRFAQTDITAQAMPGLCDHRVGSQAILPGAAYLEHVIRQAAGLDGRRPLSLSRVEFQRPIRLAEGATQVLSSEYAEGGVQVFVDQEKAMSCLVDIQPPSAGEALPPSKSARRHMTGDDFYQGLASRGNNYGPAFQTVTGLDFNEDEVLATLKRSKEGPMLVRWLDAAAQVVAATDTGVRRPCGPFVWSGVERVVIHRIPARAPTVRAVARRQGADVGQVIGDAFLIDARGRTVIEMHGLALRDCRAASSQIGEPVAENQQAMVAVASTFTANPIERPLQYWRDELDLRFDVAFAPYGQAFQQLLDPASLLSRNSSGANVLLIRPEDWLGGASNLNLKVSAEEKERLLETRDRFRLSDDLEIAHLNRHETEYLAREIFEDRAYLKHGITLRDGDCVVDAGANIGLFSLFVEQQIKDAEIYAFEPSPRVFEILKTNAELYGSRWEVHRCGLSDRDGEASFTFYRRSSVMSTYHPDAEGDRNVVKAIVQNVIRENADVDQRQARRLSDELMVDRMASETITCGTTSLSSFMQTRGIDRIDLLKVDVEGSELAVLAGISPADWRKIEQVVVEVHDQRGDIVRAVMAVLQEHGFRPVVDEESLLAGSGLYNVYAPSRTAAPSQPLSDAEEMGLQFSAAVKDAAARSSVPHLVCICPPSPRTAADARLALQVRGTTALIQTELANANNVVVIDGQNISRQYAVGAVHDPRRNELGHIPYTDAFFAAMGTAIVRKIRALRGQPHKVIVLDCDDTLWTGVCGEDGPEGIRLEPERIALQRFMASQAQAGMLLCLCSKNNERDVDEVFAQRPDMVLQRDDFAAGRVNWRPKSENLRDLAHELQLGLDSFVFIDDSPLECEEVRVNCPEVLVLELPRDPEQIPKLLQHVWAFDRGQATSTDRQRAELYKQESQRRRHRHRLSRTGVLDLATFTESLELQVDIAPMTRSQIPRVSQLTLRTNQFNLTAERMTEDAVAGTLGAGDRQWLAVSVRDRFGDYGLVGAMLVDDAGDRLVAEAFLLSCRALGRGVEYKMVARLGELALSRGLARIELRFLPTRKNQPARDFLDDLGATRVGEAGTARFFVRAEDAVRARPKNKLDAKSAAPRRIEQTAIRQQTDRVKEVRQLEHVAAHLADANLILEKAAGRPAKTAQIDAGSGLESQIEQVWREVLDVSEIKQTDRFSRLGGDSLRAIRAIVLLEQRLAQRGVRIELSTVDMQTHESIPELAAFIREHGEPAE